MAVKILHAVGEPSAVNEDARYHGVVDHLQFSRGERGLHQIIRRIEKRADVAAAPAGSAVVAGSAAIVLAREDGAPSGDERDPDALRRLLQQALTATRRRRGQMIAAAGQRILIVVAAANADQLIHLVVIRRHVFVADRPGNFPAVALGRGEIEIGVAQRHAAPHVGLAAAPHTRISSNGRSLGVV